MKVLVEGGRNQDSNINAALWLSRSDAGVRARLPADALVRARRERRDRALADLRRRMANAVLPEAGSAHVEELSDPYLLWFWNSNVRSTAIVLEPLADASRRRMLDLRADRALADGGAQDGRWGNTQENAIAMEALVAYYRSTKPRCPTSPAVGDARRRQALAQQRSRDDRRRRRRKTADGEAAGERAGRASTQP